MTIQRLPIFSLFCIVCKKMRFFTVKLLASTLPHLSYWVRNRTIFIKFVCKSFNSIETYKMTSKFHSKIDLLPTEPQILPTSIMYIITKKKSLSYDMFSYFHRFTCLNITEFHLIFKWFIDIELKLKNCHTCKMVDLDSRFSAKLQNNKIFVLSSLELELD